MARSKREIPHYYLTQTVDMSRALAWLEEANRERPPTERLLPAVLLLKATALALAQGAGAERLLARTAFRPATASTSAWRSRCAAAGSIAPAIHDADRNRSAS